MSRWKDCPRPSLHGPRPGELWRHYKGDLYLVLFKTNDSEGKLGYGPNRVVYQLADGTGPVWDRPSRMWEEEVELHSYHSSELDMNVQKPTTRRFILEGQATSEQHAAAIKTLILDDLTKLFEQQWIGRAGQPFLDQELADSNAKAMFGPEARGAFEPVEDDPRMLTWRVTIPLPIPSDN